ncbi:MAG: DUF3488 and DUF4129 domain-containing transglutaminase family protein [Myxococcota bacterium]
MTRREFRGAVEGPRPAAAWLMSLVASATLWITEQIPLWVIAVQVISFAASYLTRNHPPAFRTNPIWLNIFMIGITTVTIRSALDGNPATISLAYFTALTQGLQLLDARPRKSEFVLVALSLFQVILASNLTDSVLFPPLLVAFLGTVTWTLLVHTLAMEAAEAGDPAAVSSAIAPDLRRATFVATAACLVLAMALFVLLPRLKTNVLRGSSGRGIAMAGFSNRVALGDVGKIRSDDTVVLRVEALEGELPPTSETYWRGLAFDRFDGRNWSISDSERVADRKPISGIGRFGIQIRPETETALAAQRIIREPVNADVIFTNGQVARIQGPFQNIEADRNGGLYLPGRGDERIRYTIWSQTAERRAARLTEDRAEPPLESRRGGPQRAKRYLQLPENLDPKVKEHAETIAGGAHSDFEKAWQIQQDLRENGKYTDAPPPLGDENTSPIEAFILGAQEGHCEYFASAMVVLARSQGLPARLVNGFAGGVQNDVGGFLEVTRADAHAWVEVHFEEAGWVRFDPTPPDLRLRSELGLSMWARLAQVGSAVELWWFQRVVDFDSADQIGALRSIWMAWKDRKERKAEAASADAARPDAPFEWSNPLAGVDPIMIVGALMLLLAGGALIASRGDREPLHVPEIYRRAQRILAKKGFVRAKNTSARDFASEVGSALEAPGADAFHRITEQYLAERFGKTSALAPEVMQESLRVLEHAVERMGLRNEPNVR